VLTENVGINILSTSNTYTRAEFIDKYGAFIHKEVKGTGILAGTLIAQAILESSGTDEDGEWKVGGSKLSREANAYLGIKANNWSGKTYNIDTGEIIRGKKVIVNADFRAYNSVKDSIKDYVKFLQENHRYSKALKAKTVSEQAKELKKAGYATSLTYAETVNNIYLSVKDEIDKSYNKYKRQKAIKYSIIGISIIAISLLLINRNRIKI
jgi:flagellum-specific peptidoglycan hydrolase FlgJ